MRRHASGFTLIELLVTITIIAMLIGLTAPQLRRVMEKANSTKCLNNLRQIGVSANLYANDNGGKFPLIESMPSEEVYQQDVEGENPKPIFETLSPYGLTQDTLKCAADLAGPNYFTKEGSSYQWRNMVDGELTNNVKMYGGRGGNNTAPRSVRSAFVVICTDYEAVHGGRSNRLYADGHVRDATAGGGRR